MWVHANARLAGVCAVGLEATARFAVASAGLGLEDGFFIGVAWSRSSAQHHGSAAPGDAMNIHGSGHCKILWFHSKQSVDQPAYFMMSAQSALFTNAIRQCIVAFAMTGAVSLAIAATEAPAIVKADPARGGVTATGVCAACHTVDGSRGSPANPILQGQHPQYLTKQLIEYKSGKRDNPIMKGIASTLSEEDMKNVSAFYASKTPKPGAAKDKDLVSLGQRIYRGGIADRKIPACSGCHSPSGAGIPSQYPRLAGQHAEYAVAQLTAFRDGIRQNSPQMSAIAAKLNDREIKALAEYAAGLQ